MRFSEIQIEPSHDGTKVTALLAPEEFETYPAENVLRWRQGLMHTLYHLGCSVRSVHNKAGQLCSVELCSSRVLNDNQLSEVAQVLQNFAVPSTSF
jgi:hypothetical protein